jgi:hypothetical protein
MLVILGVAFFSPFLHHPICLSLLALDPFPCQILSLVLVEVDARDATTSYFHEIYLFPFLLYFLQI